MADKMQDLKGRAKEAVGDLTDNKDLKREGKIDQGVAKAKETASDVADKVGDKIRDIAD